MDELNSSRSALALVVGAPTATDKLADTLVTDLGLTMVRVGAALAPHPTPPTRIDVAAAIGTATVLLDLDCLLWPDLGLPLIPFLMNLARARPVIAVWPGEITGARARYSVLGRPDYYNQPVPSAFLLRPRPTRYPDEVPYVMERVDP